MSVQRIVRGETLRYRARVKSHGRELATRVFERKRDAVAWEQEQRRALRSGEWFDPRRGRIALSALYPEWLPAGSALKRKTREADESAWRNQGQVLTLDELHDLARAATGRYAELVTTLGLCGLRWGELAALRVGDLVEIPGPGLRLQRAVLASSHDGSLYVDSLKGRRARTVPLPAEARQIVDRWAAQRAADDWLFPAPQGGPLSESNGKRSIGWPQATTAIGDPTLRPHDLRHTAASIWLGAGADPKVVQRILGHASAAMTMDLYGHLIDRNLWEAADRVGGTTGARGQAEGDGKAPSTGVVGA